MPTIMAGVEESELTKKKKQTWKHFNKELARREGYRRMVLAQISALGKSGSFLKETFRMSPKLDILTPTFLLELGCGVSKKKSEGLSIPSKENSKILGT